MPRREFADFIGKDADYCCAALDPRLRGDDNCEPWFDFIKYIQTKTHTIKLKPPNWVVEYLAERIGLDSPSAVAAGIPLSTRDDLAALCLPNLLRIEPMRFS